MNFLITGAWAEAKDCINQIENKGHSVQFMQYEKENLPCSYEWVEGVICNGLFLHHAIERFTNLKYVQLTSAGFDRVPMEYVREKEISIYNARGVYSIPMAEFAIASVLQIYKKMEFFRENQKQHAWNKHRGCLELYSKTVCIVGCGNVGTECAKRFSAFGCKVIGVDLFPRIDSYYEEMYGLDRLDDVLPKADVLVLTLPLTDESKYLINTKRFEQMKEGVVLVNIARGAIIDSVALLENAERLGGAVLDVFEEEPLDSRNPLWDKDNVVLTPHNSFVGEGNKTRLKRIIFDNLEQER